MIRKCLTKFKDFNSCRGIDIVKLIEEVERVQAHFDDISSRSYIEDRYIITLKV